VCVCVQIPASKIEELGKGLQLQLQTLSYQVERLNKEKAQAEADTEELRGRLTEAEKKLGGGATGPPSEQDAQAAKKVGRWSQSHRGQCLC
jgi:predicted  nucleic acid-binding Zn-ribbon protein